tara:strand:- start:1564 stop:2379 length:816 start_codon:yes stop_codon:yes gene_type:complete
MKKNLIYQCWKGILTEECKLSSELMRGYAKWIGAEYRLDIDPDIASKLCDVPMYFEWLNPIIDESFEKYDKVLTVDLDVFPVDGLGENIFEQNTGEIGVCTEPFQPQYRLSTTIGGHINGSNDEKWNSSVKKKWGISLPRNEKGLLKVYNAGMVVFSNEGIQRAKKEWEPFQTYIDYMREEGHGRFYTVDQNYMHAMIFAHKMKYVEMDNGWNHQIHFVRGPLGMTEPIRDERNKNTKFVHVQLSGIPWKKNWLRQVVNEPQSKWTWNKAG